MLSLRILRRFTTPLNPKPFPVLVGVETFLAFLGDAFVGEVLDATFFFAGLFGEPALVGTFFGELALVEAFFFSSLEGELTLAVPTLPRGMMLFTFVVEFNFSLLYQ
jgi:hypothetical protein